EVVPSAARPTVHTSARTARSSAAGVPPTTPTGTCSTAPAPPLTAAGAGGALERGGDAAPHRDRHVLDRAGSRLHGRGRERRGAVPWNHHAGSSGRAGHAEDRAEVAGVGYAVER